MSVTTPGDSIVRLHRLTMVEDSDGVMIGRPDIGSYALFPAEGAQALRLLDSGLPVSAVAAWYQQEQGSPLDVEDFLGTLGELRFLLGEGEDRSAAPSVRWQRLGRWVFSWPAFLGYAALMTAAVAAMIREPSLRPSYRELFFTTYLSLIPLTLTAAQIPCVLIHESFHALAGRRLGLSSTLRLGRRLYYLVAETRLDSLLSVSRKKRYLPFLAGMLADAVLISALTLFAVVLRSYGAPAWCPGLCLALAFTCVLRLIWQFMFYLETDLYYVLATVLRCTDLQNAARFQVKAHLRRMLRRPPPQVSAEWSERDRAMARWYAPALAVGYGFSLGSLIWAGIPTAVHFVSLIVGRLTGSRIPTVGILDALSFCALSLLQIGLMVYVTIRDRRGRTRKNSSLGALA